jgi:hypothetical protein
MDFTTTTTTTPTAVVQDICCLGPTGTATCLPQPQGMNGTSANFADNTGKYESYNEGG